MKIVSTQIWSSIYLQFLVVPVSGLFLPELLYFHVTFLLSTLFNVPPPPTGEAEEASEAVDDMRCVSEPMFILEQYLE